MGKYRVMLWDNNRGFITWTIEETYQKAVGEREIHIKNGNVSIILDMEYNHV